jgi:uncharacterized protein YkwD
MEPFCARPQIAEAVAATNALRVVEGLAALSCRDNLSEQAWLWSRKMCEAAPARATAGKSYLEHGDVRSKVEAAVGPGGWRRFAENILWNTIPADGPGAVAQWDNSAPHRANILTGALTDVGMGWFKCDIGAAHGPMYFWTQLFVTPSSSPPT